MPVNSPAVPSKHKTSVLGLLVELAIGRLVEEGKGDVRGDHLWDCFHGDGSVRSNGNSPSLLPQRTVN